IRDLIVTGVQTCALPILPKFLAEFFRKLGTLNLAGSDFVRDVAEQVKDVLTDKINVAGLLGAIAGAKRGKERVSAAVNGAKGVRSEERRVGKESRARCSE